MHSHCLILTVFTVVMISFNVRSAFILMVCIAFYTLSVLINMATCAHKSSEFYLFCFPFLLLNSSLHLFRLLVAHTSLHLSSSALLILRLLLLCFLCGLYTDARPGEQFESGITDWWIYSDILSVTLTIPGAPHLPVP